jgi:hypothetical protein
VADLLVYIPSHGYANNDLLFASWLGGNYYVRDKTLSSFKISVTPDDTGLVQFATTVTDGYVRKQTGSESSTISGLDHLEGETVFVTSGGEKIGSSYTVSGGQITVPTSIISYQVGLPYAMKIKTTRLEIPQAATIQSREKNINELVVRHIRTTNGAAGQEKGGVDYLNDIEASFGTISNDSTITVRGGHSPDGYVVIKSDEPYPMTVLATIVSFSVDENR